MDTDIRKAVPADLPFLTNLETTCFPKHIQSSVRSITYSLASPFQKVIIAEIKENGKNIPAGSATLYHHPKSFRIFSIAVLPEFQGKGIGKKLLNYSIDQARHYDAERLILEVASDDKKIISFYSNSGFKKAELLPDYYAPNEDGIRMVLNLRSNPEKQSISNIIIVRNPDEWNLEIEGVKVVSSKSYITEPEYQSLKNVRIFNLSNSYQYQKFGYYVSLLASARDHRVIPNATTMRDFTSISLVRSISGYMDETIQKSLKNIQDNKLSLNIYFGQSVNPKFRNLSHKLYYFFEAPLLRVDFSKTEKWSIQRVSPLSLKSVNPEDLDKVKEFAHIYFSRKRFNKPRFTNFKYDLAILVNPEEKNPPSCPEALQNFKKAAEKAGFYTEFITKEDFSQIPEFDALFIRETTDVNNHTYHFSRAAYAEGLVVIDDPWSILRCSNKIFLHERMRQNRIKTPATEILARTTYKKGKPLSLNFPMVLKQPDSAFSLGVTKVENPEQLDESLKKLFKISDLIIAQEFIPSDYDWRIGVLDNTPLYACKYYMAQNHWQIYNWSSTNAENWGKWETFAVHDVPENVIKTAVKAATLMGDGLYGVDLKVVNGEVYIIEVNDNPNIDAGIEDNILKEELYNRIMHSFLNRIEINRNIAQFVSVNE
ncbi:MAG: GNAT family N-acetyltransferase [Prolixibacteraceae bacterium]|nr:GNAT family N-acetyltransferase [Prolixibacteraceae bacterium]MBN2774739.1 GNAT family N-acetyltransferase [Prolixibacteraceae bacterium]